MAYEHVFIDSTDPDPEARAANILTERVQKAEQDGWEFVHVKVVALPDARPYLLATMRRSRKEKGAGGGAVWQPPQEPTRGSGRGFG